MDLDEQYAADGPSADHATSDAYSVTIFEGYFDSLYTQD